MILDLTDNDKVLATFSSSAILSIHTCSKLTRKEHLSLGYGGDQSILCLGFNSSVQRPFHTEVPNRMQYRAELLIQTVLRAARSDTILPKKLKTLSIRTAQAKEPRRICRIMKRSFIASRKPSIYVKLQYLINHKRNL